MVKKKKEIEIALIYVPPQQPSTGSRESVVSVLTDEPLHYKVPQNILEFPLPRILIFS